MVGMHQRQVELLSRQIPLEVPPLGGIARAEQGRIPLQGTLQTDCRVDLDKHRQVPASIQFGSEKEYTVEEQRGAALNLGWGFVEGQIVSEVEHTGTNDVVAIRPEWVEQKTAQCLIVERVLVVAVGRLLGAAAVPHRSRTVEVIDRSPQHRNIGILENSGQLVRQGGLAGSIDPVDRHSQCAMRQPLLHKRCKPTEDFSPFATIGHHEAQPTTRPRHPLRTRAG